MYTRSPFGDVDMDVREAPLITLKSTQKPVVFDRAYDFLPLGHQSTPYAIQQTSGLDPGGVQGLLAQDAMSIIDSRIRDFREMQEQASDLADWVGLSPI
jgi:hypothetical protein